MVCELACVFFRLVGPQLKAGVNRRWPFFVRYSVAVFVEYRSHRSAERYFDFYCGRAVILSVSFGFRCKLIFFSRPELQAGIFGTFFSAF